MPGPRKVRKPTNAKAASVRFPGVQLDSSSIAAGEADKPKWIQIARTGLWKGYRTGQIEFTREVLETIVENFHSNPSYEAGPDGYGAKDVVPWDFDHASEQDPTMGELPVLGAPAQAWSLDLEIRDGKDGVSELWSLTRLLEPVRTYIAEGKIKWTSVGVWRAAVDPVSGRDIGPLLTSVAFTNKPFIQGMAPIAARMDYYVSRASDAEDALCQIKGLLGMPQLSGVGEVQLELAKLKMWLDQGSIPIGVDGDEIVSGLRTILGLPALASAQDVFTQLGALVPALVEQQKQESAEGGGASNLPPTAGAPMMANNTAHPKGNPMDPKNVLALAQIFKLPASSEDAILAAAKEAVDTKTKLGALLKALGVEDSDGAIGKITGLMKQAAELEAAMPELKDLREEKKKKDAADEEGDVAAAIAAHNLPDNTKEALILLRRSDAKKFHEQFPIAKASERHLTQAVMADGNGSQRGSKQTGAGGGRTQLTAIKGGAGDQVDPDEETLESMPGRNITEKAMSFIAANVQGADKWTFDARHEAASRMVSRIRENAGPRGAVR